MSARRAFRSDKIPKPSGLPITTVVNVKDAPSGVKWRYIGRAMPARKLQASRWENPNKITQDTPANRDAACNAFRSHLFRSGLIYHLGELRGEALGCWCTPLRCHGHTLAAFANILQFHKSPCPECSRPLASSIMTKSNLKLAEYWKCSECGAYGFQDRGAMPDL